MHRPEPRPGRWATSVTEASELSSLRESLRGRAVVLATGCFDLLHVGHLFLLTEASRQGDVLFVGVNGDDAVHELKGPDRPIVAQEQRAALVGAFACVDYAFVFEGTIADDCIRQLRPHVYVMGEESVEKYSSELAAARAVGARIHVVKRDGESSTMQIIASLRAV